MIFFFSYILSRTHTIASLPDPTHSFGLSIKGPEFRYGPLGFMCLCWGGHGGTVAKIENYSGLLCLLRCHDQRV